jgi:hypothetical protein
VRTGAASASRTGAAVAAPAAGGQGAAGRAAARGQRGFRHAGSAPPPRRAAGEARAPHGSRAQLAPPGRAGGGGGTAGSSTRRGSGRRVPAASGPGPRPGKVGWTASPRGPGGKCGCGAAGGPFGKAGGAGPAGCAPRGGALPAGTERGRPRARGREPGCAPLLPSGRAGRTPGAAVACGPQCLSRGSAGGPAEWRWRGAPPAARGWAARNPNSEKLPSAFPLPSPAASWTRRARVPSPAAPVPPPRLKRRLGRASSCPRPAARERAASGTGNVAFHALAEVACF